MALIGFHSLKHRLASRFERLLLTTYWFPLVLALLAFAVIYEAIKAVRWWAVI